MAPLTPELYACVLNAAPDAVLVVDSSGRMVFVNEAVQTIFGRPPDQLIGAMIEELIPPTMRNRHRDHRASYGGTPGVRHMGARMEIVGLHADGREISLEVSLSPVVANGQKFTICIARDATERRQMIAQLRELSHRDALTGLFSRMFFDAHVARLEASGPMPVACFMFDLDSLKIVNDVRGHAAGDELIRRAASLLRSCFRDDDIIARVGGDEFAVLVSGTSDDAISSIAARIRGVLDSQIVPPGASAVSLSVGWAIVPAPPIADAITLADQRMYEAKRAKRAKPEPVALAEEAPERRRR
jgi:diguanylate cyclase (GGDEF)-like protein/PAS domain S-box-containing protein